jgi:PAS domain S-box-containing protein
MSSTALGARPYVEEVLRWLPDEKGDEKQKKIEEIEFDFSSKDLSSHGGTVNSGTAKGDLSSIPHGYILLADDNADMREYLNRLLSQRWEVKAVGDGVSALKSVNERVPDLVLTDVMMPEMGGFELLQKLRENPQTTTVPVIFLSARAGEESCVEGLQAGADDYLIKPFSARELLTRVETHLKMAQMRREVESKLREMQEQLKSALTAARMMVWSWDLKTDQTTWSGTDIIPGLHTGSSKDFFNTVHPDDKELVARAIARTLRGESPYNIEFRIIKPDGQVRWIGNQGAVHHGPDGELERFVGLCCDITERKRTEQKLTLYKEIFDNSIDGIAVIDPQGYYLEQNSAHRSIVGYTDEELRDKTPAIHLGEEVFSNLTQELATSGMYRGEVISHTKNGASIPLELSAFAVRNDLGEPIYYVGIKRDITERKQTEQQLYQRIDQLQSIYNLNDTVSKAKALEEIYEEALDGLQRTLNTKRASILLIDPDGVMRFKAWRGLSDKYRKAVEGHSPWSPGENNPKPILIPDVAERSDLGALRETILGEAIGAMGFIPLVYQGRLLGKFMVYYDAPHQFSDDEIQLVQTISSHVAFAIERKQGEEALKRAYDELEIRVQERTRELVEVNKALQSEIAERERMEKGLHQSEERFRLLVESVKDYAIFMLDTDGFIVSWNAGAEHIMGYKSEEIIGKHFSIFYPEEDIEHGRPQHNLGIAVAEGRYEDEGWRERKDGSKFWGNVVITALRDEYGNLRGFSKITRDLTERRKMEEERLKFSKLESVGILAGGIAHDFNNLLTGIMTAVSSTKIDPHISADAYENLTEAEKICIQAKRLTQQLLTFSKGGTPIKKLASIERIIRESVSLALRGSNVKCNISIEEDLWDAEVDEGQISQAITNLLINADQAMPQGRLINITAHNIDYSGDRLPLKEGRYVRITVEDEGIGIPQEHIARIFDPYFTTKQKGSGLGLAVVYSIIKSHNGYIDVESQLGKGTRFHVYIPASPKRVEGERVERKKIWSGEGRVLIMDDEGIIRNAAGRALVRIGYEVEYAKDGAEAIELYTRAKDKNRPFDVVIMDLTVPGGMGGKEAIEKLISIDPDVRAIVSSGYSNDSVMSEYRRYGFKGVLSKPYSIGELTDTLHKVMEEMVYPVK